MDALCKGYLRGLKQWTRQTRHGISIVSAPFRYASAHRHAAPGSPASRTQGRSDLPRDRRPIVQREVWSVSLFPQILFPLQRSKVRQKTLQHRARQLDLPGQFRKQPTGLWQFTSSASILLARCDMEYHAWPDLTMILIAKSRPLPWRRLRSVQLNAPLNAYRPQHLRIAFQTGAQ